MTKNYLIVGVVLLAVIATGIWTFSGREKAIDPETTSVQDEVSATSSDPASGNLVEDNKQAPAASSVGGVRGSCYIKADSQCIDYLGSAFSASRIKTVCGNQGAVISNNACPTEARVGGCRAMMGTEMEMISWLYSNGDKPADSSIIELNKTFCTGMGKSQWLDSK